MSLNILNIVENEALCRMVSGLLEADGHAVTCIIGRSDVVKVAREMKPELIVLEVSGEQVGVLEVKQRLQRLDETRDIPVIVISDHPELEYELLKVFDFIPKPVDLERLREDVAILARGGKKKPAQEREPLGDVDYQRFHDYLVTFSGLHFEHRNAKVLERGLQSRMMALKIGAYGDYYRYLLRYGESRHELQKLLPFLTVGETYFFRYHPHFSALKKFLLTEAAADRKRPLRFWSAGCSTGEEPYSMAMLLMETLPDWRSRDIRILATDINNRALKRARDGVYGLWSMRAMEERYLKRFFERVGKSYILNEEVKSLVEFSHLNLQTDEFPTPDGPFRDLDVVFCRNVMIYFTFATMKKVIEKFAASLGSGGHLFLGHAETLSHISSQFERHSLEGGFYYRKKTPEAISARQDAAPTGAYKAELARIQPPPVKPAPVRAPARAPARQAEPPAAPSAEELYRNALALFDGENFTQASRVLDEVLSRHPGHVGDLVTQGFILANNGHFQESLDVCQRALAIDDLFPEAYFLKGLVLDMSDRLPEAKEEYRKAILLKADFVMPHYNLGRLFFRLEKVKEGVRELRNSLKILEKDSEESIIPYSGGLSREVFLGQLRNELARVA
jgi:chemotaxis protein methyltransferase CheR